MQIIRKRTESSQELLQTAQARDGFLVSSNRVVVMETVNVDGSENIWDVKPAGLDTGEEGGKGRDYF